MRRGRCVERIEVVGMDIGVMRRKRRREGREGGDRVEYRNRYILALGEGRGDGGRKEAVKA